MNNIEQVWTSLNKFGQIQTSLDMLELVSIDQNLSHLLKIRSRSQQEQEEEDQKASPRSAIEDLADKINLSFSGL